MSFAPNSALYLALLCAPLAASAQGAAQPAKAWVEFKSTDCRCAADFPGQSRQIPKEGKTPDGRTVVTQFQELADGDRNFTVSWLRIPGAPKDAAAKNRLLDAAAAAAPKANPGAVLLRKRSVSVGGTSGLAYAMDLPTEKIRVRQQIFIAGDRLIQQTYSGPAGSETGPEVERFVRSLKILP